MECFWRLRCHRQQNGNRYQQDPPVLHLYIPAYHGLANHHLHGACFLAQSAQIYHRSQAESLVLSLTRSTAAIALHEDPCLQDTTLQENRVF